MNRANVSYTRNHLSEMLSRVREGESILIVDRQRPVACLEPVAGPSAGGQPWHADLVRRGLIQPAKRCFDLKAFGAMPLPAPKSKGDILNALLADREEGR